MSEPKVSDLLRQTFGISAAQWTVAGRTTTRGTWDPDPYFNDPPDQWDRWGRHTAAEMGPGPDLNPVAFAKPAPKRVRA